MTTTIDLTVYTKDALIEIAKRIPLSLGDYARKPKALIRASIEAAEQASVERAIAACVAEGLFEEVEDDEDDDGQQAAADEAKAAIASAAKASKSAEFSDDAVQQLVGALGRLVKPGLSADDIRGIVRDTITEELSKVERPTRTIVVSGAESVDLGEEHLHPQFDVVLKLAGIRENVMLVGPAGTGKTHLAHQVARALDMEFASISCTVGMSESQLLGWLLPTGDAGKFEYVESDFVRLYENGGVFLLDELDAADPNTLTILNQALANGGFHIPQRKGKTYCERHPDFICLGAANTFGTGGDMIYAGRERIDGATLDRFTMIVVDYDTDLEKKLVDPGVLQWGHDLRQKIAQARLRRVVSTRRLISMTKQLGTGMEFSEVKSLFLNSWNADERQKAGV